MVEYHGWATIRESYDEQGEDPEKMNEIVKVITKKIGQVGMHNEFYDLRCMNGTYCLTIQGAHNHRNDDIIELFKWIANIAIGSYGLLYIHDDEDHKRGNDNRFKTWRMKKGKVDELDDPFLSPVNPTIEE